MNKIQNLEIGVPVVASLVNVASKPGFRLSYLSFLKVCRIHGEKLSDVLLSLFGFSICLTPSDVSCGISFCPPSSPHHFRSGCQSALLIFKGTRAWNRSSEHGPDFHSLIFPSHFPLFLKAPSFLSLLTARLVVGRQACNRQVQEHGPMGGSEDSLEVHKSIWRKVNNSYMKKKPKCVW